MSLRRQFALVSLLLLTGCQMPHAQSPADPLEVLPAGSAWQLVSSDVQGLDRPEASVVRLRLEADQLAGDSGCNRFGASYTLVEGRLRIGSVLSSKRGCPGTRAEIESALFLALPTLTTARREGDQLILSTESGSSLRFAPDETGDDEQQR